MKEKNRISRRSMLKFMGLGTAGAAAILSGCAPKTPPLPRKLPCPL